MAADHARIGPRDLLLLALVAIALLTPGLLGLPPVDRDESRYAVATTQMLKTHDFVDIRFQDQPRYLQPAGVYWLQSISAAVFTAPDARQIWAYRLPSLLAAILAVLMTAGSVGALFGRKAGLVAGGLLACCLSLSFEARIAKTDAALLAAVTTAQFALMRVYLDRARSWRWPAVFWAAAGAGVMLKGPIIAMILGLTVLALVVWDRRVAWLARLRPAWGLPLFLAIVLPWYVAIGVITDGEFFQRAVGDNLLHKVGNGQQAHGAMPGYHLMLFLLTFWPGSLLAAMAVPFAWRERRRPEVRFLICWIVPAWLVFELVATKLPHYVLPTFPAIAALTAVALFSPADRTSPVWRVLFWLTLLAWLVVSVFVALLPPLGLSYYHQPLPPFAPALAALALAMVGAMLWMLARRRPQAAVAAAMGAALFATSNLYMTLPRIEPLWLSPRIVKAARAADACERPTLITTPYHEPSLVFLNGPDHTRLVTNGGEAADGLAQGDPCAVAVIGADQGPAFQARAAQLGLRLRPLARVKGQNYSDGEDLDLSLYTAVAGQPARGQ